VTGISDMGGDDVQDLIDETAATAVRATARTTTTFLVARDAIVVDWFASAGAGLGIAVQGCATSIREALRGVPQSDAAVVAIDQELADGTGL
jgi:hypothetical protein